MSPTSPFPPVPRTAQPPGPSSTAGASPSDSFSPPGGSDGELDDAVARLRAVRDAVPVTVPAVAGTSDTGAELAERLRARRSARHVAAAYSAAHGHPLGLGGAEDDGPPARPRWALGLRAAAVAGACVLAVALVAAAVALRSGGEVEPLAPLDDVPVADAAGPPPDALGSGEPPPGPVPEAAAGVDGPEPASGSAVVVHVVGQVGEPGVVTLPDGARVADALEAAGGATEDADLGAVNLARTVVDGEQVYVPAPGEEVPAVPPGDAAPAGAQGAGPTAASGLVDLNTADAATLQALPGIGPVLSERIVAWRDQHGPFASVDELGEISGIGPAILSGLHDAARV